MIGSLRLQKFRSYSDSSFEFDPGVNIVVGPNASGKTNLLEAILVLAGGKSYRGRDAELMKRKAEWSRLDGWFDKQLRVMKLTQADETTAKVFELDQKPYKRLSLENTIPVVLFEPEHLRLISGSPERRRDFFDDILERTEPGFKTLAGRYRRTLAQRNALLKQSPSTAKKQLFAWDIRLSELGGQIAMARVQLVDDINKSLSGTYSRIAGKRTKAQLLYQADAEPTHYSSRLLKKLASSVDLDFSRGFTGHGPHREDIIIMLGERPAGEHASRGEVRSLLLALKIFELKLLEKKREVKPLFLLDDVFSELDGSRRQHLVEQLSHYQTIITTTDADSVMHYFSEEKLLPV